MRTIKTAALALALPGVMAVAAPAAAAAAVPSHLGVSASVVQDQAWQQWRDRRDRYDEYRGDRYGRRHYDEPVYAARSWRGRDGRTYCRKDDGTVGLIVGGAAGALLGREIAGRGERTLGAILGGAGGALLGREIDRGNSRCR